MQKYITIILMILLQLFMVDCNTRKDNPLLNEPTRDRTNDEVTIQVKTVSYNGKYSPRNVGAIWIEESDGSFVKTLRVWAQSRREHLVKWNEKSSGNLIDAITSATKSSHTLRETTWNAQDINENQVEYGTYILWVEMTEDNSKSNSKDGKLLSVEFELTDSSQTLEIMDESYFKDIQIIIQ